MANLNLRESDRGQLIIVTAFALAVLFVALALILNSAIFAENLASRGQTTGSDKVVDYRSGLVRGATDIMTYENENVSMGGTSGWSHTDVRDNVREGLGTVESVLGQRSVKAGATGNVGIDSDTEGTLVRQLNGSREFTDDNGTNASDVNEDWTMATNVTQTRSFQINVTDASTSETTFNVTNGSSDWELKISDNSSYVIEVDNGSGSAETCDPVSQPFVVVDVTAGTVGGEDCSGLNFSEAPDGPYEIRVDDGDETEGTYSLIVDNSTLGTSDVPVNYTTDPSSGEPSVTPALYDITLGYQFQTVDVTYNSTVRVAPGEPDA